MLLGKMRIKDDTVIDGFVIMICTFVTVIVLYPLLYVISASISDPTRVVAGELVLWPVGISLEGYEKIFNYRPIWIGYRNTILYTTFGTLLNLCLTLPAAYALSRKDFYGKSLIMIFLSFTMFFNGGLIPTYLVMMGLRLVNKPVIMILLGAVSVWNTVIARTFFQSNIPFELQEAAYIDGCTTTRLFAQVILPLSKPIIAVLALFCAVSHWNAYFNGLIYLSKIETFPLQIFLRNILILDQMADMIGDPDSIEYMIRQMQLKESMKFGIVVVSSIPVLVMYPFLQKYFIKGMMVGALKG